MSKKRFVIVTVITSLFIFGIGFGLGYYTRNETINPQAKLPTALDRIFTFFVQRGEQVEDDILYHDTNITDFIVNGSTNTKVAIEETVQQVIKEPDGDYHVSVGDLVGLPLVTEFIPEISLPLPKVGDHIRLWGITRFDAPHNWWELHPVTGWSIK